MSSGFIEAAVTGARRLGWSLESGPARGGGGVGCYEGHHPS